MFAEATIVAVSKAIEAACNLGCSPEGQATLKAWREDWARFRKDVADLWAGIKSLK